MNKNLKRIIAIALAFGTISAAAPATNLNLLTTKAYASENTDTTLDSLELKTSSGSTIKLYSDSDYDSDSRLDENDTPDETTYYAKTSASAVNIDVDGPSNKYVKVFKGTSNNTKGKSITSDISISSSITLTIRVYDDEPGSSVEYDDDNDDANKESEYKIKINYTGSDSDSTSTDEDNADNYDDIYLDKLSVDYENISLSTSKVNYTYNVADNINEVTIKAVPEDDDYTVRVDGTKVYEDESYKTKVSLKTGLNEIPIKIEDEDNNDEREYTLKITRGGTTTTGTSTVADATAVTGSKVSQWVLVNGKWQYNDVLGNPIKNSWFYDRYLGKNYYLQADGSMATGWLFNGGKWYYLGSNGAMFTGWIYDNGKYYYLYSDGSMAADTKINGYKLGTTGAWIR